MTLNGVIAFIWRFLTNSIALQADYAAVVEDRPIVSLKYCPQFQSFTFGHNYLTLQRGLSVIAELLVQYSIHIFLCDYKLY